MIAVAAEELVGNRTRRRAVEKWDGQLAVLALFHGPAPVIHKSSAVFVPPAPGGTAPQGEKHRVRIRRICAMGVFRSQSARPYWQCFFDVIFILLMTKVRVVRMWLQAACSCSLYPSKNVALRGRF